MQQFKYIVKDPLGLHARPAGLVVKAASAFESSIRFICNGKEADAKRIMAVMGLGVKTNQEVIVTAEGSDETAAIDAMKTFFNQNL